TAGLHQYKFIVSGNQWIPDPTNPDAAEDGFGGRNSLYTCVP
nr:isoamylase [Deltaproteobacteria bacterium]